MADLLHVVDPQIRSKLDELKRIELDRLRKKATEAFELSNGLDRNAIKEPPHLDHRNPHTFRSEDLRKLILKVSRGGRRTGPAAVGKRGSENGGSSRICRVWTCGEVLLTCDLISVIQSGLSLVRWS